MLEALAQTPGEFARRVCGVSETDTVAVVPRGVKEIPDYGFYGLSSLRRVDTLVIRMRFASKSSRLTSS